MAIGKLAAFKANDRSPSRAAFSNLLWRMAVLTAAGVIGVGRLSSREDLWVAQRAGVLGFEIATGEPPHPTAVRDDLAVALVTFEDWRASCRLRRAAAIARRLGAS